MGKKLLIETRLNSLSLLKESASTPKRPGCLGTMKGICADYGNPTRNGNFYSRKLWENAFNDPLIKESLKDRVLIGELDHPDDRLETKAVNAAIVMTDYEFDDNNKVLLGTFDILDTPQGKILRSLLDYGCKIGVSSRGEGDVTDKNGVSYVDENSFNFVGFDAVVLPAVKSAKPSLQESVSNRKLIKSFKSSILEEIKSASTKAELDLITKVIKSTNLPDTDSLYESVNIKSKELEGSTSSSNLIEDIRQLTNQNQKLKQEVKKLKEGVITNKSSDSKSDFNVASMFEKDELSAKLDEALNQYRRLKIDTRNYVKSLNQRVSRLKTESWKSDSELQLLESNNKSLQEELRRVNSELSKSRRDFRSLQEEVGCKKSKLNKSRREYNLLESRNVTLQDEVNRKDNLIKELTESRKDLQLQVDDLQNQLTEAVANYSSMKSNLREIKKSGNNKIEHLNSLIEAKSRKIDELSDQVCSMDESVEDKSDKIDDLLFKVQSLKEELLKEKSKNNKLADKSSQLNSKLKESVNNNYNMIVKYAEQRAREYGLSRDEVLKSIDQNSTIESVNTLIESIRDRNDRYNKLPITTDISLNKVTKVASNSLKHSEEDDQTLLFLNSMYKN